jgi:hypothetical protein
MYAPSPSANVVSPVTSCKPIRSPARQSTVSAAVGIPTTNMMSMLW